MNRRDALGAMMALGTSACTGLPLAPRVEEAPVGTNFTAAVPYIPTRPEIVDAMLTLASISARDVVYDLGCGDGRIVIAAAKRYGASGLGVDIQLEPLAIAESQAHWEGVSNRVKFSMGDLFDLDLRPATVVMLYLSVELNVRLHPKLLAQLRPGSRVVSNRFDMANVWRPARTIVVGETPIHLWRIDAAT
ncbi:MAG: SAM-dependent methyltransferase [Burkholderiales bacterium]